VNRCLTVALDKPSSEAVLGVKEDGPNPNLIEY